jgi:membrane protease YdiL (CAAX protease family)
MQNNNHKVNTPLGLKLLSMAGIVAVAMGFIILSMGVGGFVLKTLYTSDPSKLEGLDAIQTEKLKNVYLIAQFAGSFVCLVILPAIYLYFLKPSFQIFKIKTDHLSTFLTLSFLIILSIIPLINIINDWNQSLHLPAEFSDIENKLKEMESLAEKAINLIIYYQNPIDFIVILIVVAILPAIGEELLFRGVVQNEIKALLGNHHIAIWFAAFLFSFVHFQFFGFFPRMLLGVLLGYLYYWSGNILVPMFLHFMNNAITLITMNLVHQKVIDLDLNSSKEIPSIYIIFSFTISMVLLYIFWKTSKQTSKSSDA